MATCQVENCNSTETTQQTVNFTAHATKHLWYAEVAMCDACYQRFIGIDAGERNAPELRKRFIEIGVEELLHS